MSNFSQEVPTWGNTGIKPPVSKMISGWSVSEKPPAQWFNWLHNRTGGCIQEIRQVYDTNYAAQQFQNAGGTATAIELNTQGPSFCERVDGKPICFKCTADNLGAATKINDAPLYKLGTTVAPILTNGNYYTAVYSTTGNCFYLLCDASDYLRHGISGITNASGTSTAYTLTPVPALSMYSAFLKITLIFDKTNTGASTINISGKGAVGLKKQDGTDYAAGELPINTPLTFIHNGTSFLADSSTGLGDFFGDGSDGAIPNLNTITTAPNGGTVANLFDMNSSTIFTTNSLSSASDQVVFQIDFVIPQFLAYINGPTNYIYPIGLWNATLSVGTRTLELQYSDDNVTWTPTGGSWSLSTSDFSGGVSGTPVSGSHRYWRAVLKAGGSSCTVSIKGITINYSTSDGAAKVWRIIVPAAINSGIGIKNFSSINLPSGYEITTDNPCQGLILYSKGDVTIDGIIDMSQKAGIAPNGDTIPMIILSNEDFSVGAANYNPIPTVTGTAFCDSTGSGGPSNVFDSNISTSWGSGAPAASTSGVAFIGYDFGESNSFNVRKFDFIQNATVGADVTSIKLQYCDDGINWILAGTFTVAQNDTTQTFTVSDFGSHRYWRFVANSNVSGSRWTVSEIRFYSLLPQTISIPKIKLNTLTSVLLNSKGGYGGNGGYGGGYSGSTGRQVVVGMGGPGRQNLGGFGGGGSGGSGGNDGGIGGTVYYAELGGADGAEIQPRSGVAGTGSSIACKGINGKNGGGAGGSSTGYNAYNAQAGKGGRSFGGGGGGSGASNSYNGGTASSGASDGQYAGGFILIIAAGNVTVNSSGFIKANGGYGGSGTAGSGAGAGAGGGGGAGGAGGGVITLLYKGLFSNSGTLQVNGGVGGGGGGAGAPGEAGGSGTSGSVGTIINKQI